MTTATATGRWVASNLSTSYNWAQCSYCGRAQQHDCPPATCLLCGTVQCHGNGGNDGTCRLCHHGYLPGWGRNHDASICGRKGCDNHAVTKAPRIGQACSDHAKVTKLRIGSRSITLADYAAERVAHRDSGKGDYQYDRWRWAA